MSFIYLAVYSDGTSYVGQTLNSFEMLEKRYQHYEKKAKSRRPSEQACFALGMPALGVIEYCPPEKLDEREKYWIAAHWRDGKNLNIDWGGCAPTKEERQLRKLEVQRWKRLRRMESKLAKQARRKMR